MTIQEHIHECLNHTTMLRQLNPNITEVRYNIMDIGYDELLTFSKENNINFRADNDKKRAYVIYSPFNGNGELDTDIWFYSVPVNIRPAEIVPID